MIRSLAILVAAFLIVTPFVSSQTNPKDGKRVSKAKIKKPARIISLGVINSRAIDLVKPEYSPAALLSNVYGQVQVSVTIDENGQVASVAVLNGHPLLRSASVASAVRSTFEPLLLSGEKFRFNGTINYNYLPKEWNWLEIGYALKHASSYYSIKNLVSEFPTGFSDESKFLEQAYEGNADWDKAIESITAIVRGKLSNNARSMWLFEAGSAIAAVREKCCRFEHENHKLSGNLNELIISAPSNISAELVSHLGQLANLIENREEDTYSLTNGSRSYQLLKNMEPHFPFIGR